MGKLDDALGDSLYAAALAEVAFTIVARELPQAATLQILAAVLTVLDDYQLATEVPRAAIRRAKERTEALIPRYARPAS